MRQSSSNRRFLLHLLSCALLVATAACGRTEPAGESETPAGAEMSSPNAGADAATIEAVRRALAADPVVGGVPIDVRTREGGVIQLFSTQTNQEQRTRAMEVARQAAGAAPVEDMMK